MIMILDVDVTAEGGIIKRIAPKRETTHYILCIAPLRGPPIGSQDSDGVPLQCSTLYTLLPLRGISPQGETRDMREKTASHMLHVPPQHFPLWWLAPPPCPVGSMSYDIEN